MEILAEIRVEQPTYLQADVQTKRPSLLKNFQSEIYARLVFTVSANQITQRITNSRRTMLSYVSGKYLAEL